MRTLTLFIILLSLFNQDKESWKDYRPDAKRMEIVDDVWEKAQEYYANGENHAAKAYCTETIARVAKDSTRCALDFEARIMMANIEENLGNVEFARRWLLSINRHYNANPWVKYPDNWRQRLGIENQRNAQLMMKEASRKAHASKMVIFITILSILLLLLFVYLYIAKTTAYKALARKAEKWAREADLAKNEQPGQELEIKQMAERIKEYLEESRCYLTPGLKLDDVVTALASNRTYVSKAVNTIAPNFNALVNEYRIKESVRIMLDDRHIPLDQVSIDCGFNNRKSFNEAFKNFTGLTPSDFRRSN